MKSAHPSAPITGPGAPSALENFLDEHVKKVVIGIAVLLALVATIATLHLKRKNFEAKAGAALVAADDMDSLRRVIADYGDTPAAATAGLLLADRQLAAGDAKGAETALRAFIAANPKHPLASQARLALANALLKLGDSAAANTELSGFISGSPTSPLVPLAMVMQAEIAEVGGDLDGARKIYADAKANYPDSNFAMLAGARLDRVGFVLPTEIEPPPPPAPPPVAAPAMPTNTPASAVPPGISIKPLDEQTTPSNP